MSKASRQPRTYIIINNQTGQQIKEYATLKQALSISNKLDRIFGLGLHRVVATLAGHSTIN